MTDVDLTQAKEAIRRCREHRLAGRAEAVLRGELDSRLRLIFPTARDEVWINHYTTGAEARTRVGIGHGTANRFIDNLIGATTIEYEADLRTAASYEHGLVQVKEHTVGLIRSGVPSHRIRGILSDTVQWYAYDVALSEDVDPAGCTTDDVTLRRIYKVDLTTADDLEAERLTLFLRSHIGREQSQSLRAEYLALDLGLDSGTHVRSKDGLVALVEDGRATHPSIGLATDLWSEFVDHPEGATGGFRAEVYADAVYLIVLARLLSANILAGEARLSTAEEIATILDGSYFRDHYHLDNMVEHDYFGWITRPDFIDALITVGTEMQRDLYAYDFDSAAEEDLFGRLLTQLAGRSQRTLLGQESTPVWLSRLLAERCIETLPTGEAPRAVDMCCGSGTIVAEVIKAARSRGMSSINTLRDVATGFDIDPLAVSLAKTTWVITLAAEIREASTPVTIPIYHADSLFSVTPLSPALPLFGDEESISISLDGVTLELPHELIQPVHRDLFERIVDWAYDQACVAQEAGSVPHLPTRHVAEFVDAAAAASGVSLSSQLHPSVVRAAQALANRMAELAVDGRNGIWAFILRNTYRPGLLTGQFNALVSNPPWLAMSRLANNPYQEALAHRASLYGIRPTGSSFLHLELATTHLLHAVDRYLKPGASVTCLVPGTVFNGHHHEPLRQRAYLHAERPIALDVTEVWQIESGTFKYPGAAIAGRKGTAAAAVRIAPIGFLAGRGALRAADLSVRMISNSRSAWVLVREGIPVGAGGMREFPQQGADLMPRTAVCIDILSDSGSEYRVDTPRSESQWSFSVKAAKKMAHDRFPGYVAPSFIYRMAQSNSLLPFHLGPHRVRVAIPALRDSRGVLRVFNDGEIRRMGFTRTARRFRAISARLALETRRDTMQEVIDERGKLTKQVFGAGGHLIVVGAGGKHICAACLPNFAGQDLVVDQTLYWKVLVRRCEAWFYVAMLNTRAMTESIMPFNPKGDFGERHIHTLPYRLMPEFDSGNEDHVRIAELGEDLALTAQAIADDDSYINSPERPLHIRRSRLRARLSVVPEMNRLEELAAAALGTTPMR
ncbi:MAG: hypothetical protein OXP69_11425 [Spirochaetaceae bacterium]|nr:hypothetical protein [Spirochaetaceae bacterium]